MGLFKNIFGSKKENDKDNKVVIPWHELTSEVELDQLVEESKNKLVAVYKHSPRCGISRMVLNRFEGDFNLPGENLKLYFLDVLKDRALSREFAAKFEVIHESPQLILLQNGKVVHQASHQAVQAGTLSEFLPETMQ